MTQERLPAGLVPGSGTINFDEETVPEALRQEHTLTAGHWGVLHVFEGDLAYITLNPPTELQVTAPDLLTIPPEIPHRLEINGPVRCRIDFFRQLEKGKSIRTPGTFADDDVRLSLQRCEANGDFGETFYEHFLKSSPEVPKHFAATNLERQRKVLRDSVYLMASHDVASEEMRLKLDSLGTTHGRDCRDIHPALYEHWLDSVCATVKALDPEWSVELERKWRVRMRPGMQIVMAAY